jgi:hypothetical protein
MVLTRLSSDKYKPQNYTPAAFEKFRDLHARLLSEMAQDLGYKYDYTHRKENAWNPSLYGQEFEERATWRNAAVRLGGRP